MNCELIGKIPIDPALMRACDSGTSFVKENKESKTSQAFIEIVRKI